MVSAPLYKKVFCINMAVVYCASNYVKLLTIETVIPRNFNFGAILDSSYIYKGDVCLRGVFLFSVAYEEVLLLKYCGRAPLFLFKMEQRNCTPCKQFNTELKFVL
jgi:hypothetical protein